MIGLLAKKFIKGYGEETNAEVRQSYGILLGAVGIALNIFLFIIKILAGIVSGSVAILADSINNLSDAGSSIVMMIGFKMAGKKPDPEHPFGHGRIEYVTGLIVSLLIILMGVELVKSSVTKIISPTPVNFSYWVAAILILSIAIKLYMYSYNIKASRKYNSAAMKATAMDSLTDSVATLFVLLAMVLSFMTGIRADGISGLLVAGFILYTGITSAKDTLDPLLGSKPSKEYIEALEKFVSSYDEIIGMHDLVVHDYGPGRVMISFHAEVSSKCDILEIHDTIDNIEKRLRDVLNCHAVIHLDPVVVGDEDTDRMRRLTDLIVKSVDESFMMHDFRMVKGNTHTNLIFDVVVPYECPMSEDEVKEAICQKVESLPGTHYAVVEVDRPFA